MTDKIRECPFCGGEAMLRKRGRNTQNYVVCENCGAVSKITETKAEAIKAWNKRSYIDDIVEQLEEQENENGVLAEMDWYAGMSQGFHEAIVIVKGVQNE